MIKRKTELLIPLMALFICGVLVIIERMGVTQSVVSNVTDIELSKYSDEIVLEPECLILIDSEEEVSMQYLEMLALVFDDMSVGYDVIDTAIDTEDIDFNYYKNVVIAIEDWQKLSDKMQSLDTWVNEGGSVMVAMTPTPNHILQTVATNLGIESGGEKYTSITGFHILDQQMIGAESGETFYFDSVNQEEIMTSLDVQLGSNSKVIVEAADSNLPILWMTSSGEGRYIVLNDIILEKYQRGFIATAYSLLKDVSIYPVINASAYYLDDFPSPVPDGDATYIKRDYGVSTTTFYNTIWWPEVMSWETDYGIKHTGLIIEEYVDEVEAPFSTNQDTTQFTQFGNMLINNGGELGYHGYNHMPLCLEGIEESYRLGTYELWPSVEDMMASLAELQSFSRGLFPQEKFQVYVPPSNIIADAGLDVLKEQCPEVKVIASSYMYDASGRVLEQEFEIAENGFIYTPRITSGCMVDDYQKLTAMSELNFHYVQSHFLHPDDTLDKDRGANLGWEKLSAQFKANYLDWMQASVPDIRQVTGSKMGQAVADFDAVSVQYTQSDEEIHGKLGGFYNEAYLMMRLQKDVPAQTQGCEVSLITGDLYIIHATADTFSIQLETIDDRQ